MDHQRLESFAQEARCQLHEQVRARLEMVLRTDNVLLREREQTVDEVRRRAKTAADKQALVEQVAYTWFNRFCALRYMDVNRLTRVGVVSPVAGFTQPEILQDAKQGVFPPELDPIKGRVTDLLTGRLPSDDPQAEAYRLLLRGVCNAYHRQMPFLFEAIDDFTELLMPNELLSERSILQMTRDALTPEACADVEVIGWLYQYYISEKKDRIMARKGPVPSEDVPARTQLFTPHWIVRYLVENSLGRLWLLNHPDSRLAEHMDYYIAPEQPETDFLRVNSPEELRLCDPACGSGHMLTYAFDLLYAIYEEQGYDPNCIPQLILEKNLYGIEIDPRAGMLAAFALTMKACQRDRRYLNRLRRAEGEKGQRLAPNVCVLRDVQFTQQEIDRYLDRLGRDLFTQDVGGLLAQFAQATTYGSLIRPVVGNIDLIREKIARSGIFEDMFLHQTNHKVQQVLEMAEYLSPRYQVVVANPPYMGSRYMNAELKRFARDQYPDTKSDLFAMFIERGFAMVRPTGYNAMVTMESWMFLSSYESLRSSVVKNTTILSMVHMPYLGKGSTSMGINFGTAATIWQTSHHACYRGLFSCVRYYETDDSGVPLQFPVQNERLAMASVADFQRIPGAPIAYWVSDKVREVFVRGVSLGAMASPRQGLATTNNGRFLRLWSEVATNRFGIGLDSREEALRSGLRWFPYNKGGDFRKWCGNSQYVVNWEHDGLEIREAVDSKYPYLNGNIDYVVKNRDYYFKPSISWSKVSSANLAMRYYPGGHIFDVAGCSIFAESAIDRAYLLGFCNTTLVRALLEAISPTLNFEVGHISKLPVLRKRKSLNLGHVSRLVDSAKADWDAYETSWDFTYLPLVQVQQERGGDLRAAYNALRARWQAMTDEMQRLEVENNRLFIEAYGLQEELTPDVPLSEITLTCNPHYRYPNSYTEEEREARLRQDTIKELVSYGVGCMFGRYSLERPGLVLANQGETLDDYLRQVPQPSFPPVADNVLPMLDGNWFAEDVAERFKAFLRAAFGDEHYPENLRFVEEALGREARDYFLKEFWKGHTQRYSKRPIYWLFSSPKGSFNALIYMHRYREDTVSIVLRYLREYREKLAGERERLQAVERDESAPKRERSRATKELGNLSRVLVELQEYESDVLYPLASQRIAIDLDDGVQVNYAKFGDALRSI